MGASAPIQPKGSMMALLRISHPDGREYLVHQEAFDNLYKPFGFKPSAVVYGGAEHVYSKANVEAANAYDKAGTDPNVSAVSLETAARQAEGEETAASLRKQAIAASKAEIAENPPAEQTEGGASETVER